MISKLINRLFSRLLSFYVENYYKKDNNTIYNNDNIKHYNDFTIVGNFRWTDDYDSIIVDGRLTNPTEYNPIGVFTIYRKFKFAKNTGIKMKNK